MAGNVPNVSRSNFRYSNLLLGGLSVPYDSVPLQQGVPVLDSDFNEMQDYQRLSKIVDNLAMMGLGFTRFGLSSMDTNGFIIKEAAAPSNDFSIGGGFAAVAGIVVPSTLDDPPADFDYSDQVLYSGAFSGIVGAELQDTSKLWTAADELPASAAAPVHGACFVVIVNSANPAEIGHAANIVSNTTTSLTIDTGTPPTGYTIINPANLAAGDTYQVKLPLLTTPAGDRTDDVYLQLWFEDINELEDIHVKHPGVAVETVHKTAKRWAVRVSEGASSSLSTPSRFDFGVRYASFGQLNRLNATAAIASAQIVNSYDCFTGLSSINPLTVDFTFTNLASKGYLPTPIAEDRDVQHAVDLVVNSLASTSAGLGSALTGSPAMSGTPESLSSGTLLSQLTALLGHVNNRIEAVNPETTISAPVPIFRSHNLPLTVDTNVTSETVTVYLVPVVPTSPIPGLAICMGCYLSGSNAATGSSGPPGHASAWFFNNATSYLATKDSPIMGSTWAYATPSAWDSFSRHDVGSGSGGTYTSNEIFFTLSGLLSADGGIFLGALSSVIEKAVVSSTDPSSVLSNSIGKKPGVFFLDDSIWLVTNAYWAARWIPVDTGASASAIQVRPDGIRFYFADSGITGYGSGWALEAWDYYLVMGAAIPGKDSCSPMQSSRDVHERIHFDMYMYAPAAGLTTYTLSAPVNYRLMRLIDPVSKILLVTFETNVTAVPTYTHVDDFGGVLTVVSDSKSYTEGELIAVRGYLDIS